MPKNENAKNENAKNEEIRAKLEKVLANDDVKCVSILAASDINGMILGAAKLIISMKEYQDEQEV